MFRSAPLVLRIATASARPWSAARCLRGARRRQDGHQGRVRQVMEGGPACVHAGRCAMLGVAAHRRMRRESGCSLEGPASPGGAIGHGPLLVSSQPWEPGGPPLPPAPLPRFPPLPELVHHSQGCLTLIVVLVQSIESVAAAARDLRQALDVTCADHMRAHTGQAPVSRRGCAIGSRPLQVYATWRNVAPGHCHKRLPVPGLVQRSGARRRASGSGGARPSASAASSFKSSF